MDKFLYCDPPYVVLDGIHKGLYPNNRGAIYHNGFRHEGLAERLREHKGGALVSYNDCPLVRELYKDYEILEMETSYGYSAGTATRDGRRSKKAKGLLIVIPRK